MGANHRETRISAANIAEEKWAGKFGEKAAHNCTPIFIDEVVFRFLSTSLEQVCGKFDNFIIESFGR
jgi:hypothetical protein